MGAVIVSQLVILAFGCVAVQGNLMLEGVSNYTIFTV